MTAGSVGATAAPINAATDPRDVEQRVGCDRHEGCGGKGSEHPDGRDRYGSSAEPAPADVHASVEEDHDQRHRGDALHVDDPDLVVQLVEHVRERRGADEDQRSGGDCDPVGEDADGDRGAEPDSDEQDGRPELAEFVHEWNLECCAARLPPLGEPRLTLSLRADDPRHTPCLDTRWSR